jgi:hypothetical protein
MHELTRFNSIIPSTSRSRNPHNSSPRQTPATSLLNLCAHSPLLELRQSCRLPNRQRRHYMRLEWSLCSRRPQETTAAESQVLGQRSCARRRNWSGTCQLCRWSLRILEWRQEKGRRREDTEE